MRSWWSMNLAFNKINKDTQSVLIYACKSRPFWLLLGIESSLMLEWPCNKDFAFVNFDEEYPTIFSFFTNEIGMAFLRWGCPSRIARKSWKRYLPESIHPTLQWQGCWRTLPFRWTIDKQLWLIWGENQKDLEILAPSRKPNVPILVNCCLK